MTAAMLLEAIGMVNDKAIKDAKEYRRPKSRNWVKWGAMVACLCLLVVAAIPILNNMHSKDPVEPHQIIEFNNAYYEVCEDESVLKSLGVNTPITAAEAGEFVTYLNKKSTAEKDD